MFTFDFPLETEMTEWAINGKRVALARFQPATQGPAVCVGSTAEESCNKSVNLTNFTFAAV
jgi:hypothetical protein